MSDSVTLLFQSRLSVLTHTSPVRGAMLGWNIFVMKCAVGGAAGYSDVNCNRRWKTPSSNAVCSGYQFSHPVFLLTGSFEVDVDNINGVLLSVHNLNSGRRRLPNGEHLLVDPPDCRGRQGLQRVSVCRAPNIYTIDLSTLKSQCVSNELVYDVGSLTRQPNSV
jgi:hypothetical protein